MTSGMHAICRRGVSRAEGREDVGGDGVPSDENDDEDVEEANERAEEAMEGEGE